MAVHCQHAAGTHQHAAAGTHQHAAPPTDTPTWVEPRAHHLPIVEPGERGTRYFPASRYADTSGHTCQGASRAAAACGRRGAGRAGGSVRGAAARGGGGGPAVAPAARERRRDLRERRAQLALCGGLLARGLRELGHLVVHVGEHLLQVGHLRRRLPRRAPCQGEG